MINLCYWAQCIQINFFSRSVCVCVCVYISPQVRIWKKKKKEEFVYPTKVGVSSN